MIEWSFFQFFIAILVTPLNGAIALFVSRFFVSGREARIAAFAYTLGTGFLGLNDVPVSLIAGWAVGMIVLWWWFFKSKSAQGQTA
ncbi:hypothetical protein [Erythrobacter sp. EC-HK427]|uniref:hypothetical protein n=1 Tax=Erythrobacter sp. EC-HK427 TaxID=2038396 RepID=UPI001251D81E|nr:hypothetical protein [Erythrobacter sp. EC-HK427]VVT16351.1 hypothetical protein ERY430_70351 [Erythrobacter sp. EC-HK427]